MNSIQVYFAVSVPDFPFIINYNMRVTQMCVIFPFLLETSKGEPNFGLPASNWRKATVIT